MTLPADEAGNAILKSYPVILIQTSYNTGAAGQLSDIAGGPNPEFVKRGYATVVADVRGTGSSSGKWQAFDSIEQQDSYEIIDWASKQSWSNGKIGLYGVSYLGITSLLGASTQHIAITDVATGYDIESHYNGESRYIEVKTTISKAESDFFFSLNEYEVLKAKGEEAYIYRIVFEEKGSNPEVIELNDPFGERHPKKLKPVAFQANLNDFEI